jgi:hypothetical protein
MLEWLQMVEQLHLFHLRQNQIFVHHLMFISDFLMTIYFNNHYGFVQQVVSTFNYDPRFLFFKTEYFLFKSHTLNKYSCYHVY